MREHLAGDVTQEAGDGQGEDVRGKRRRAIGAAGGHRGLGLVAQIGAGDDTRAARAAIRPPLGAGVRTALIAGAILWLAGLPIIIGLATMGVFEWSLVAVSAVPSLIVNLAGAYVAGWLYTEA
ncbi:MAG: hypothetical protein IT332_09830 [Ardenticatenales bacterium]|nr:hypothetical protein [Ardenticatenales bacterium]